ALGFALPEKAAEEVNVFVDRKRRIQVPAEPLRHVRDPRAYDLTIVGGGHICAEHLDEAGLNGAGAGNQGKQTRFADPVRADQPDHATSWYLDADIVERQSLAEPQADLAQARDRF